MASPCVLSSEFLLRLSNGGRNNAVFRPLAHRADRGKHAPAHHRRCVSQTPEQLGQIGTDKNNGFALRGQPANPLINLHFAADVDPASRLVQQQHSRIVMQQAADRNFLLIASGKLRDRLGGAGGANIELLHPMAGDLRLSAAADEPVTAKPGRTG